MAHRTITDVDGVVWEVWDVHPTLSDRRRSADRRHIPRKSTERRVLPERRVRESRRGSADSPRRLWIRQRNGWLAFGCATERRRLPEIPSGWEELPEEELLRLLAEAQPRLRERPTE